MEEQQLRKKKEDEAAAAKKAKMQLQWAQGAAGFFALAFFITLGILLTRN